MSRARALILAGLALATGACTENLGVSGRNAMATLTFTQSATGASLVSLVGPDSGPMHVAAATATPVVALFGPTLPANFAPWRAQAVLIERELACRPCKQRECLSEDFRCLRRIEPAEVFAACRKFLSA